MVKLSTRTRVIFMSPLCVGLDAYRPLELLVKAARIVRRVLVAAVAPPQLVPEMNRLRLARQRRRIVAVEEAAPLEEGDRAEDVRRLHGLVQAEALHDLHHQRRSGLAEAQRGGILRCADLVREGHRLAAARRLDRAVVDEGPLPRELAAEDVRRLEVERRQTDHVGVYPPSAPLQEQLVAEEVREA